MPRHTGDGVVMDCRSIALRAYSEKPSKGPSKTRSGLDEPSGWSLVFDVETTTDPGQGIRFGGYQVRKGDDLHEEGLFFDSDGLSQNELVVLRGYCERQGLKCRSLPDLLDRVFYRYGYELAGTIVGFNLPFDLSRLAQDHGEARGSLRGGFSFDLWGRKDRPHVRVKHLSRHAALIGFAAPGAGQTPRGMRNRGLKVAVHRGYFVDVKTLARALTGRSFSLASLCDHLQTPTRKLEVESHGAPLTETYLDYARADVQASWECFAKLRSQYLTHGLETPMHRILSEASLGKAYLSAMGVRPLLQSARAADRSLFGKAMGAYYGGRAEVRWRRTIKEVRHYDFKSMYPTVNALLGLWRFVIADGYDSRDATAEVQAFLDNLTPEAMFDRAAWKSLTALARVRPDRDLLPVRANYDGRVDTIGLNYLTAEQDIWYTIADLAVAKLLSGKTPSILEAIRFEPGPPQEGLKPIDLFGSPEFRVDPAREDVFKRLVDLRDDAKARRDPVEKAIKIVANATSYGIFVEVNRDDAPKPEALAVVDPWGDSQDILSTALEDPGKFFHPILAVLITGAARLMLALAERAALDEGMDWVFCDTDSLAIARPDGLDREEFLLRCDRVAARFASLNPYAKLGSILQAESYNFDPVTGEPLPLFAFAISAKRYALFNLDAAGRPILRKASAHGLGHLRAPYGETDTPEHLPKPTRLLSEIGVDRWQHDLWLRIVQATLDGHPDTVDLDLPNFDTPAISRYGATSPRMLAWFKTWNSGRPYRELVKPFNFMLSMQGRNGLWGEATAQVLDTLPGRGRPKARGKLAPVAPFERDHALAIAQAFDRETGEAIAPEQLMTYREVLAQYHLSPESKFLGGDFLDRGRTERRHVFTEEVRLIGKEGNRVDETAPVGLDGRGVAVYSLGR